MADSNIERIVLHRVVHQLVAQRLVERVFNRPLISNVERGQYVECMVELALSEAQPPWSLTDTWAAWDLVQRDTGARIEVKQSAFLQTWSVPTSNSKARPSFDIRARSGYSDDGSKQGSEWQPTGWMRQADIYVMAWHDETDPRVADHRKPGQWQFYIVAEHRLPPEQKSIGLNPLADLGSSCLYSELADEVAKALDALPDLKVDLQKEVDTS